MQRRERGARKIADRAASALNVFVWCAVISVVCFVAWGLIFPAGGGCGVPAKIGKSRVDVRNITSALKSFHYDYGHFPEIGTALTNGKRMICVGDPACKISSGPNSLLFDVLRAMPRRANANHALNPKEQKYFEMGKAKDPKHPHSGFTDGPEFSDADQGCLFDPWGRQYCIVFTMDDSGTLDLSTVYSDLSGPGNLIRSPVAAFSLGKDGIAFGKGYEGKLRKPGASEPPDDIFSWQ